MMFIRVQKFDFKNSRKYQRYIYIYIYIYIFLLIREIGLQIKNYILLILHELVIIKQHYSMVEIRDLSSKIFNFQILGI